MAKNREDAGPKQENRKEIGKLIYKRSFPIEESMRWELFKENLRAELIVRAEGVAQKMKIKVEGKTFEEAEMEALVAISGTSFIVSFYSPEATDAARLASI